MVEETRLKVWQIVQTTIGSLVVASLLGLAGSLIAVRDAVIEHDILLERYERFIAEGDRYTAAQGRIEREARIATDVRLSRRIVEAHQDDIALRNRLDEHEKLQEHEGANRRLEALEESMGKVWGVINQHLKPIRNGR